MKNGSEPVRVEDERIARAGGVGAGWVLLNYGDAIREGDGFIHPAAKGWIDFVCRPDLFRGAFEHVHSGWLWRRKVVANAPGTAVAESVGAGTLNAVDGGTSEAVATTSDNEELRLAIATYKTALRDATVLARNIVRTNSKDVEDWRVDVQRLADSLERQIEA